MSKRKKKPSLRERIAEAHAELVSRLPHLPTGGVLTHCWACGADCGGGADIAHVQASSQGGSDEPGNLWLLCMTCHAEQPDGAPRSIQEAWLLTQESAQVRYDRRTLRNVATMAHIAARHGVDFESAGRVLLTNNLAEIREAGRERSASTMERTRRANADGAMWEAFERICEGMAAARS